MPTGDIYVNGAGKQTPCSVWNYYKFWSTDDGVGYSHDYILQSWREDFMLPILPQNWTLSSTIKHSFHMINCPFLPSWTLDSPAYLAGQCCWKMARFPAVVADRVGTGASWSLHVSQEGLHLIHNYDATPFNSPCIGDAWRTHLVRTTLTSWYEDLTPTSRELDAFGHLHALLSSKISVVMSDPWLESSLLWLHY